MHKVERGDTVTVHYTGKLRDGTVFDTSRDGDPLRFEVGAQQVVPGFEAGVLGMAQGETKTLVIAPEDAYGPRNEALVFQVPRDQMPPGVTPEPGMMLELSGPDGQSFLVTVANVDERALTLDANHPLAGEELHFEVEIVGVQAAAGQE